MDTEDIIRERNAFINGALWEAYFIEQNPIVYWNMTNQQRWDARRTACEAMYPIPTKRRHED